MLSILKQYKLPLLLVCGSILFYTVFAYDFDREDFIKLITLYAALFFLHLKLIQFQQWNFNFLFATGILFRLVFIVALPSLSQDFYRFIWDGELITQGINPYAYTPNQIVIESVHLGQNIAIPNQAELYQGMGELSAKHYSNYPPINQLLFAMSTFLGFGSILGSVIWMRLFIIIADVGTVLIGRKLLKELEKKEYLIFFYFLNPLVILELTGNLHFEGIMFFLFITGFYLITKNKLLSAAPIYAASIFLKLVPLLFLPIFFKYLKFKKSILFYTMVVGCCALYLLPFINENLLDNYQKTIELWFSNFEFNASIYNLVKYVFVTFFEAKPWELIITYGSLVKVISVFIILSLAFIPKNNSPKQVLTSILIVLTAYYFLSATVHPWYIVFLVGLAVFSDFKYPIVWSAAVILSYFTYSQPNFEENLFLISLEYILVFGVLFFEVFKNHNIINSIRKK